MVSHPSETHPQGPTKDLPRRNELRKAARSPMNWIVLPFLGSRASDQCVFQYLLNDISNTGVGFSIPNWVINREHLKTGNIVNLHIPFESNGGYASRGTIRWTRWDDEIKAQFCGIQMEQSLPAYYPHSFAVGSSGIRFNLQEAGAYENLLQLLLKDAQLIKKGILIYMKHLVPFFYRVGNRSSDDYSGLKETVLEEIRTRIRGSHDELKKLRNQVVRERWKREDLCRKLDLEKFRENMQTEIHRDVLLLSFDKKSIQPYLNAIYELEKKQYYNYNTIVMLYIHALTDN